MKTQAKVLIIGGGFGGVRAALDLAHLSKETQITFLSNNKYHCYHPDLYEVLGLSTRRDPLSSKKISSSLEIPLQEIFKDKKQISLLIDGLRSLNPSGKSIQTLSGDTINYEYLVLALGSETCYYGVSGAKEYSQTFKSLTDALKVRADLENLISQKKPLKVVVAGGGFTGVEVAGKLAGFLKDLAKLKKASLPKLTMVEALPNVLTGMPDWAQKAALKRLKDLGVDVLTNKMITQVEAGKINFKDGSLEYDYLIWTTGVEGQSLSGKIQDIELNKKHQIPVMPDLSSEKYPDIFVVGDLAGYLDAKTGRGVPAAAWAAIEEGQVVAYNIWAKLSSDPTKNYQPIADSFVVPIGGMFALSNVWGLKLSGVLGWLLKRGISLNYFLSILPFSKALALWWGGIEVFQIQEVETDLTLENI